MMRSSWREWPLAMRVGCGCLALALFADVVEFARLRQQHVAPLTVPLRIERAPAIVVALPSDAELVREAGLRAPFDLVPPPAALVMSGPVPPTLQPVAPVRPRLMGTVVQGQGGFVMVELPDARMQLVRIGEKAGDLRLRSVSAGEAVFDDPQGTRISLRTPRAGAGVDPRP